MSQALLKQVLDARATWAEIEPATDGNPAKRVKIRRPSEYDMRHFIKEGGLRADPQSVHPYVIGWEGITEADVLGASIGSDAPADFSPELWAVVSEDHMPWLTAVCDAFVRAIVLHFERQAEAAKN